MSNMQNIIQLLSQHSWIDNCNIYTINSQNLVYVTLSSEGIVVFREKGRSKIVAELERNLNNKIVINFWRFVDKEHIQGNNLNEIEKLFQPIKDPIWFESIAQSNSKKLVGKVPLDLVYFNGHFANFPLVPGVVEMQWIIEQISLAFQINKELCRIEKLKFQKFLRPNDEIILILNWEKENSRVRFQLQVALETCASGLIVF